MRSSPVRRGLVLAVSLMLVAAACGGGRDDSSSSGGGGGSTTPEGGAAANDLGLDIEACGIDPTVELEGDTITLVSSFPQSGLPGAFAKIANGYKAYFNYINESGGVEVNGKSYQIEVVDKDDEYDAPKTAANIRELVGSGEDLEQAFAVFSVVGTSNNIAIRDDLGEDCIPNLFAATGSPAWGNPEYPWMIGSSLVPYTLEAKAFADYLVENDPDAKVAILIQDDDFGAAYADGFAQAIEGTDITVVATERYAPGFNADVNAQMTSLAASGADTFFNGATLLSCPNALKSPAAQNWERTTTWVSGTCISKTLMGQADEGNLNDGVISLTNIKDPQDPQWDGDEAMELYRTEVVKAFPDEDTDNGVVAYGWTQGALFVEALKTMESVTRLNLMTAVRTMDGVSAGLLLPDVTLTSAAGDEFLGETFSVIQYSTADKYFTTIGELRDFEGQTAANSPEELITS